ncbi:MAG TPA: hypothetical protein DEA85_06895, partial [Firmicutes bacterium]|nr:hypothetical protein [Bacillota bacterium]
MQGKGWFAPRQSSKGKKSEYIWMSLQPVLIPWFFRVNLFLGFQFEGGQIMKIAVDAMGGDNAPDAIVKGALAAAVAGRDIEIILVGNGDRIKDIALLPENVSIVEAAETIENEDKPLMAIRRKRNSSMVVALQMVKDGTADAVVSAGNTGAFMAGASLIVGRIPGLTKPALAPVLPTQDGKGTVALDIGATMDPKPENLFQYALMGNLYAQTVFGIPEPRIGLLNVGIEPEKGNEL